MLRYLLDGIDAAHVKVLVADETMLYSTLDDALATNEIDWAQPRPENWIKGGGWGASRVCLFAGLSIAQQVRALSRDAAAMNHPPGSTQWPERRLVACRAR
jgi:hypothetical protein